MTTPAQGPHAGPAAGEQTRFPEPYLHLIADAAGHGVIGRPGPRQANAHRAALGLPTTRSGGGQAWTAARLERWRDRAVDWLDAHLLGPEPAPTAAAEQARTVLALADVAVRDTWLIRFARAPHDAQAQAADRLAAIAPTAPDAMRTPIGTVLALAEWTLGRDDVHARLDWATSHGTRDYRLAQLTRALLDAGVPSTAFTHSIAGALTEQECRHPAATPLPQPEAVGTELAAHGWALRVDTQVDLPSGIAWTGTLTHHTHPVASVSRHDPGQPPVLYFPPGSREAATWETALRGAGVAATDALLGLDHVANHLPGQPTGAADPLAHPAGRASSSPDPSGPRR